MYTKILVAAGTAAAVLGIATAALATDSPASTTGNGNSTGQHDRAAHGKRHELRRALRHVLHGEVTTKGADGYVTHSSVRGSVTSVSPTAITVKAADGFTETFTVDSATRVRRRTSAQHRATSGAISDVRSGDTVAVVGRAPEHSSARPVARVVVDGLRK